MVFDSLRDLVVYHCVRRADLPCILRLDCAKILTEDCEQIAFNEIPEPEVDDQPLPGTPDSWQQQQQQGSSGRGDSSQRGDFSSVERPRTSSESRERSAAAPQGSNSPGRKQDWYQPDISRPEAEQRLYEAGLTPGMFLIRRSGTESGHYVLSMVREEGEIQHVLITIDQDSGLVRLDGAPCGHSLNEMVALCTDPDTDFLESPLTVACPLSGRDRALSSRSAPEPELPRSPSHRPHHNQAAAAIGAPSITGGSLVASSLAGGSRPLPLHAHAMTMASPLLGPGAGSSAAGSAGKDRKGVGTPERRGDGGNSSAGGKVNNGGRRSPILRSLRIGTGQQSYKSNFRARGASAPAPVSLDEDDAVGQAGPLFAKHGDSGMSSGSKPASTEGGGQSVDHNLGDSYDSSNLQPLDSPQTGGSVSPSPSRRAAVLPVPHRRHHSNQSGSAQGEAGSSGLPFETPSRYLPTPTPRTVGSAGNLAGLAEAAEITRGSRSGEQSLTTSPSTIRRPTLTGIKEVRSMQEDEPAAMVDNSKERVSNGRRQSGSGGARQEMKTVSLMTSVQSSLV